MESRLTKKPKILCLHGFRTSGAILEKETQVWPEVVLGKMDLVFIDAPFPAQGKSGVEGKYDPPYFEWFQANEDFKVYWNFNKCIEYIEDCMIKYGPFDGLLGFSQGAMLTAALPGMQAQGEALTKSEKIKFVIIIAGGKLGGSHFSAPKLAENAFSSEIECPSLHFLAVSKNKRIGNTIDKSTRSKAGVNKGEDDQQEQLIDVSHKCTRENSYQDEQSDQ